MPVVVLLVFQDGTLRKKLSACNLHPCLDKLLVLLKKQVRLYTGTSTTVTSNNTSNKNETNPVHHLHLH